jgi:predicted nuclease of predicted toxin-antitoxin system
MYRLLLDENLPTHLALVLRSRGFDVLHAREIGLRSASDERILECAVQEDRIYITLDRDLHHLLAQTGASAPSVMLLRNFQLTIVHTAAVIEAALEQIGNQVTGFAATLRPGASG